MASAPSVHSTNSTATSLALCQLPAPSTHVQADFYAKLARLQKEVLSGQHARYKFTKIPQDPTAPDASQLHQTHVYPLKSALQNGVAIPFIQQAQPVSSPLTPTQNGTILSPQSFPGRGGFPKPTGTSTIDPVLLTKSDDLVRAENHLKRLRVEKALKDAASKPHARPAERDLGIQLGAHTFSCAQVLEAATLLIKPVTGLPVTNANEPSPNSVTPNTNSYYSSKAGSRSPLDEGEIVLDSQLGQDTVTANSFEPALGTALTRPRMSGLGPQSLQNHSFSRAPIGRSVDVNMAEESYSPPGPPNLPPMDMFKPAAPEQPRQQTPPRQVSDTRQRVPPLTGRSRESESYSPPPADLEIHQPQTSTKQPVSQGNKSNGNGNGNAPNNHQARRREKKSKKEPHRLSVADSQQPVGHMSRKRRREYYDEHAQRPLPSPDARHTVMSPMPYIKSEPVSPRPGFISNNVDAPRRLVVREDGTADIELDSVGGRRSYRRAQTPEYNSRFDRPQALPAQRYIQREPIVIDDSDYTPPAPRRRMQRDGSDLRRVASLQYARRAMSPEYASQEVQYAITPSRRPMDLQPQYRFADDPYQPPSSPAFVRERHSSPIYAPVLDDYAQRSLMPPPSKRRIVVDRYGNEYIALPSSIPNMRQSVAREIEPREYDESPHYDGTAYYTQSSRASQPPMPRPPMYEHQQMSRPQHEVIDLVDDEAEWMPPPQQLRPPRQRMQTMMAATPRSYAPPPYPPPQESMMMYQPQPAPRAASMQSMPPPHGQQFQYAPPMSATWPPEHDLRPVRTMTARPRMDQLQSQQMETPYLNMDMLGQSGQNNYKRRMH